MLAIRRTPEGWAADIRAYTAMVTESHVIAPVLLLCPVQVSLDQSPRGGVRLSATPVV